MKHLLARILAIVLLLCLAACATERETPAQQTQTPAVSTETTSAAEPAQDAQVESAPELFARLCAAPDDAFDATYVECINAVKENNLTKDWDALCATASACVDYFADETLKKTAETYRIGVDEIASPFYKEVAPLVEAGLSEKLLTAVYTPGNFLDLPPCVWVMEAEELPEAVRTATPSTATLNMIDWWDEGWREAAAAQFGVDPMPFFDMCTAGMDADSMAPGTEARYDANIGITTFYIDYAQIDEEDLLAAYEAYQAEKNAAQNESAVAPENRQGEPIRVLFVDISEEIAVDGWGIEPVDETNPGPVADRAGEIWTGLLDGWKSAPGFAGDADAFELTAYPERADVWLLLNVSYPFAGRYNSSGGTVASVHGCKVSVTAVQIAQPENAVTSTFANMPGNTVTGSGTLIWQNLPHFADDPESAALLNTIIGWYAGEA